MYIQKAKIQNIKSIIDFEIDFQNPPGWHVLIGDNGAGKSTIISSMALVLVGEEYQGLRANWSDWLNKQAKNGQISMNLIRDNLDEIYLIDFRNYTLIESLVEKGYEILSETCAFKTSSDGQIIVERKHDLHLKKKSGFFSVAFGPYRRFEGGNEEWDKAFENPSFANLSAHLSVFGEDVAFTQTKNWLIDLFNTSNDYTLTKKKRKDNLDQLEYINKLINSEGLLPNNTKLENVNSKDVFFKDGNGVIISVNQMSDGYRSILSMTFELIRQLVRVYGSGSVFKNIRKGQMFIDLPGVVLIDEIDAHLHPTWQTRIGEWFLKYFPKIQFIVTTHSPLVCRAAENGSIWRLAAPGSEEKSEEIKGSDRERLIYGNVLDAYGTEVFGEDVSISESSIEKQEELVKLNKKKMLGDISPEDEKKLKELKKLFTTDAQIEL